MIPQAVPEWLKPTCEKRRPSPQRAVLPADYPLTAEMLTSLGMVLTDLGRADEAEPLLREALAIRRAKHGDQEPRTLETLSALGRVWRHSTVMRKRRRCCSAVTEG